LARSAIGFTLRLGSYGGRRGNADIVRLICAHRRHLCEILSFFAAATPANGLPGLTRPLASLTLTQDQTAGRSPFSS
jgi:hypothetical protein